MKKITTKLFAFIMAMTMLFCVIPVNAATEVNINVAPSITTCLYRNKTENTHIFGNVNGTKKFSIKTNNPSVISLKKKANKYGGTDVFFTAKKTGTAYIYTKAGKDSFKTKIVIKKYTNPVTSIKFGKTTIAGKKFNKNNVYKLPYKKFANKKVILKANAKKGWVVETIKYTEKSNNRDHYVNNGKAIKVTGGKGFQICLTYYNSKTDTTEDVKIILK